MKVILLGNAGAGKSTLSRKLREQSPAACLSLDEVAFAGGITRRPLEESLADVREFLSRHQDWIVEGCYADLIEPILPLCDELLFLNPGPEVCEAHCRQRPWEPEKFATKREQDEHLEALLNWVRAYEIRDDEYGLKRHRAIFDGFSGRKRELNHPSQYGTV
ncbi:MAG: shikimate kinase [Verrucomicrobiia bacterium]